MITTFHGNAKIIDVTPGRLQTALEEGGGRFAGRIPRGQSGHQGCHDVGPRRSDTTAVAMAAALRRCLCEIYTDVDGIFSADPRIVRNARKLDTVTFEEMRWHSRRQGADAALRGIRSPP